MAKSTGYKIGIREFVSIILMNVAIKLTDMTPTLFFRKNATGGWLIPLVSGLVLLLPAVFTLKLLRKYKDKGLIEIIYIISGKYLGFLIGLLLFIITLSSTVLNLRSYACIVKIMYFPRTPKAAILIFIITLSFIVAIRGFESIGRTSWFFIPGVKVFLLLLILLTLADIDWVNIYPIAGYGVLNTIKAGVKYTSIHWEFVGFAILFPYLRNYKSFKTGNMIGFGIATFELSLLCFAYLALFDYTQAEMISYPFHVMTRMARIGRFIVNIEAFFLIFWVIATVLSFAFNLYFTAATFGYTLGINEFEPLLLSFSALTVLLTLLPDNDMEATLFLRDRILLNITVVIMLTLPMLLCLLDSIRGRNNK
jgi:spore germination protein KB